MGCERRAYESVDTKSLYDRLPEGTEERANERILKRYLDGEKVRLCYHCYVKFFVEYLVD